MKKYITTFVLQWSRELTYRLDFALGRVRQIIILFLFYYVWTSLTRHSGVFASFTQDELLTYLFGMHLLRAFVFGSQSRKIALEINDGTFSSYLVKPINHFWYCYARELAGRLLATLAAIIEVGVVAVATDATFVLLPSSRVIVIIAMSVLLAHLLYYIMSYAVSLIAFWSREALGPRFLFEWFLEFSAGAYFPLNVLAYNVATILTAMPFAYLVYIPLMMYIKKAGVEAEIVILFKQTIWILLSAAVASILWRRGLKRYTGEGI